MVLKTQRQRWQGWQRSRGQSGQVRYELLLCLRKNPKQQTPCIPHVTAVSTGTAPIVANVYNSAV